MLEEAEAVDLKIAFHLEPYAGRTAESIAEDLRYLVRKYGDHPAVLRTSRAQLRCLSTEGSALLPLVYIYDSYHISLDEWRRILSPEGDLSVRGTDADVVAVGLWLEPHHARDIFQGGFDAAYTYFASRGASYASAPNHWSELSHMAEHHNLAFIPSVGPGYDDRKIRPWNAAHTRPREEGHYYDRMWSEAVEAGACVVSVTSYNEWGEGTQIEPAVPHVVPAGQGMDEETRALLFADREMADYAPLPPTGYLERTLKWARTLISSNTLREGEVGERGSFGGPPHDEL